MVIRGDRPGPTLMVSAGVHGDEYESMAAIQQIYAETEPAGLAGTLLMLPCCNVDAYLAGAREAAVDGGNLARVFPGKADGTLTQRVAHCMMTDFFAREITLYCDLHSAGKIMRMIPVCGYSLYGSLDGTWARPQDEGMLEVARAAARAFGLRTVWSNAADEGWPATLKGTTLDGAYLSGIPGIYCETTGTGACYARDVELYAAGVRNLMRHLGLSPGTPAVPSDQVVVEDIEPGSGNLQNQVRGLTQHPCSLSCDIHRDSISSGAEHHSGRRPLPDGRRALLALDVKVILTPLCIFHQ
jgi:predicted deacylase